MLSLDQIKQATEKTYSHSSGPGGQHANKSSTKVQLEFDINKSGLSPEEKNLLLKEYPSGEIHVYNQENRSQHQNEELAFENLQMIIEEALQVVIPRKKTKAPYESKRGKVRKMLKDKWLKYKNRFLD